MLRLILLLALAIASPARADDISAAGRGVVRVVTVAIEEGEVVGFGHGSGFAVGPNRVVTNAHVVEAAAEFPDSVAIGVVPSEGKQAYGARLIAIDRERDLALIEFTGARLAPATVYTGPFEEGSAVIALGYPGNVDLATAQSMADFITPMSPVRSQGVFSGSRSLRGTAVMLHTASIARGNSGGPLLDPCGRVIGVNSAITRADEGDATFGFAIAGAELARFLLAASQQLTSNGTPCVTAEEQARSERALADQTAAADAERARRAAADAAEKRAAALDNARAENAVARENALALAAVLLVAAALALGAAGLLAGRAQRRQAIWSGAAGAVLLVGAALVFFTRPTGAVTVPEDATARAELGVDGAALSGDLVCKLVPARSRITVSGAQDVVFDWSDTGCLNGRTQYAARGDSWERILVPASDPNVSVVTFAPASGDYVVARYLLSGAQMTAARAARAQVVRKSCSTDAEELTKLQLQQDAVRAALPPTPHERLVYRCTGAE